MNRKLHALSECIDSGNYHRDGEARTWGRLAKVSEEAGEVVAAYIGFTAQNPRKGQTHTFDDVEGELLDVAITALGAIAHLYGNNPAVDVMGRFDDKLAVVCRRLNLEV